MPAGAAANRTPRQPEPEPSCPYNFHHRHSLSTAPPPRATPVPDPLVFRPAADVLYGFPRGRRLAAVDSAWQHIEVWDTPQLGCLFTLDGRPMTSAGDEFVYHECMVHPAALTHPSPRSALVLGGGDGGAARQLLKHPGIARIVVAELDPEVVRLTGDYLPDVRGGAFDDPRVELVIGDAAQFVSGVVERARERFDLVVFDLTPPDSPAAGLYTREFYATLRRAMTADALVSLHLGSPYQHAPRIDSLLTDLRASFATVRALGAFVPLYGSLWLMAVASDRLDPLAADAATLARRLAERGVDGLRCYDARVHAALFAAPLTARDKLDRRLIEP